MTTFRSKPREIQAERFTKDMLVSEAERIGVCFGAHIVGMGAHVHTMHGGQTVILEDGDWIVPEPNGIDYYPIKPDVMLKNYTQVSDLIELCIREDCPNAGRHAKHE